MLAIKEMIINLQLVDSGREDIEKGTRRNMDLLGEGNKIDVMGGMGQVRTRVRGSGGEQEWR